MRARTTILTFFSFLNLHSSPDTLHSSFFLRTFAGKMMTPLEYVQLKAFARQDGALLSLLWIVGFACYIKGLTNPLLGMIALVLLLSTPFMVAARLRHFRDYARDGIISFRRGYAFTSLTFFYGGILLALAAYIYFEFIDHGYLLGMLTQTMHSEQGRAVMEQYGMTGEIDNSLKQLMSMRPIDYAVNMLTMTLSVGFLLGLPIAALMKRNQNK